MSLWAVSIQSRSLITNRGLAYGATILLTGAFGFIFLWLWLANARLLIGKGQVGYRNILGRSRFWSAGEIARIVDMTVNYGKTSAPQHAIYLFGLDGKRLMALNPLSWEASDLRDYLRAIPVPVDVRATPITAKEARREFPNAFGWGAQHVVLATSITMLAAIGLIVAGYVILSSVFPR